MAVTPACVDSRAEMHVAAHGTEPVDRKGDISDETVQQLSDLKEM